MKSKKNILIFITVLLFLGMFIGNYGNYQLSAVPGSVYEAYSLTDMPVLQYYDSPHVSLYFPEHCHRNSGGPFRNFENGIHLLCGSGSRVCAPGFRHRLYVHVYCYGADRCWLHDPEREPGKNRFRPVSHGKSGTVVGILMAGSTGSMAVAYATTAMFPSLEMAFWTAAANQHCSSCSVDPGSQRKNIFPGTGQFPPGKWSL